jgi:hypothetical protein
VVLFRLQIGEEELQTEELEFRPRYEINISLKKSQFAKKYPFQSVAVT